MHQFIFRRCKELEAEVAKRDADLAQMAELFKKETALRKKYKNDLEDLKGWVAVVFITYWRSLVVVIKKCFPMQCYSCVCALPPNGSL